MKNYKVTIWEKANEKPKVYKVKAMTIDEASEYGKKLHQDVAGTSIYESMTSEI